MRKSVVGECRSRRKEGATGRAYLNHIPGRTNHQLRIIDRRHTCLLPTRSRYLLCILESDFHTCHLRALGYAACAMIRRDSHSGNPHAYGEKRHNHFKHLFDCISSGLKGRPQDCSSQSTKTVLRDTPAAPAALRWPHFCARHCTIQLHC